MMSLTYTAYVSRRIIKYGGVGLAVFLVFWSLSTAAIKAYRAAHPPYVAPTVRYGQLPKIVFPEKTYDRKDFTLELQNDAFPAFKDQARVYIVYRPDSQFRALEYDTKSAKDLGFVQSPVEISTGVYQFTNPTLNQTLTMNVLDGSFRLEYPYKEDQLLLTPGKVPDKTQAIAVAQDYLETAKKFSEDLKNGEKKITFWKIEYAGLTQVSAQADANIVRVDFFRENLEKDIKIYSSEPGLASISVLVTGSELQGKKIAEVNYKYVQIDRESFSTYPIKTPEDAYTDLQSGNYWPLSDVPSRDVVIRRVTLGYFEPVTLTNYLQPVFVFEGDNGFTAFVPAVTDKYVR